MWAIFEPSETPDEEPIWLRTPKPIDGLQEGETITLFAQGVSKSGGWKDTTQYYNNCWASVCSLMLDWYLNLLSQQEELPDTVLKGVHEMKNWFADKIGLQGQWVNVGLQLYFSNFLANKTNTHLEYKAANSTPFSHEMLSVIFYEHLKNGDNVAISAYLFANQYHAMNVWGAEFDHNGYITKLYITESYSTEENPSLQTVFNKPQLEEYIWQGNYRWKNTICGYNPYYACQESYFQNINTIDVIYNPVKK